MPRATAAAPLDRAGAEAHYRALIENSADGIAILGAGGIIRYESPSVERIMGCAPEELVGRSIFEWVHPDDVARAVEHLTALTREPGATAWLELRMRHADGSWRTLEATLRNLLDDPEVAGVVVNYRDATQQRKAQEAHARLAAILETTTDFVGTTDSHGRVRYLNRAARRVVGIADNEDVSGLDVTDLHPRWATEVMLREALPTAAREGEWTGETALLTRDGREIPVSQVVVAHRSPSGATEGFSTTIRDITERKRAEEALRASEERFRALIENASDLILITDPDGTIRYQSPSVERVLGYGAEELTREDLCSLVHPDDVREVRAVFEAGGSPGHAAPVELRFRHREGAWRTLEARATSLVHVAAVGGFVLNARDVTERQRLEEELRQAQKMEAVGRLAGGIAHDFNNLLTVIKGHAELALLDLETAGSLREDLEEVQRAAERASSLTRQLLAFSRKQILQPRLLSLNEVVMDVGRMLRRMVGEDVELRTVLDPALWTVRADPGQLEQVLLNLVVNARDAMPRGGELVIETRNVDAESVREHAEAERVAYATLSVRDTGTGMEPEVRERVFEPFFTTKEQGKGTGLGLSTVYGIARQSGGYVRVESEPGRGSSFTVYLPQVAEAREGRSASAAGAFPGGSETVLLVEDEGSVRLLASRVLERGGYTVLAAGSGREALDVAERHEGEIHLLFTDVVMPGMSGRELAQRLLPLRPAMRLLYTSGYTEDAVVRHGVSGLGMAFLEKPFAPDALARRVREVLDADPAPKGY